jgi:cytochrome c-type biogenesis protein CcmH
VLRFSFALLFCLMLSAHPAPPAVFADSPPSPDQRALRIERTLACPQCTNLPLDVCDQDICADMRAIIQQQVSAGQSDQTIREFFVQRYGSRVLLAPQKSSGDGFVWLVPFAGLLAGAVVTLAYLRAARKGAAVAISPSEDATARHYRTLVEQEIRESE